MNDFRWKLLMVLPAIALAAWATTIEAHAATAPAASPPAAMQGPGPEMRASRLLGMAVEDRGGERIGEVKDLVIDTTEPRVAYAVMSRQDGMLVAVPANRIRGSVGDDRIRLHMAAADLAGLRTFDHGSWPDFAQLEARDGASAPGRATPTLRRASELLDADLRDRDGDDVGDVEDIIVGLRDGRIRYGVAEFDPSWFERGKLVAVPVERVRMGDDGELVLTMSREQLRDAPAFDKDRWPDLNEDGFRARLDRYAERLGALADRVERRVTG